MKKVTLYLFILFLSVGIGFVGCGGDDDGGPTGPTLSSPTGLTAEVISDSEIHLAWNDDNNYVLGYRIYRSVDNGEFTLLAETDNGDVQAYEDEELDEGVLHQYKVKAYISNAESGYSNIAAGTTMLRKPTSAAAERESETEIRITWVDNSEINQNYEVHRSERQDSNFELVSTLEADDVEYLDAGLTPDERYYYKIRAVSGEITSDWSRTVNAETSVYYPNAPDSLKAEVQSSSEIRLQWRDRSEGMRQEDGFVIELMAAGDAGWTVSDTLDEGRRNHNVVNLNATTEYTFRVYAFNEHGDSDYSNEVTAETEAGPPVAPGNFSAEAPDWSAAVLTWEDMSGDELGFIIQRKMDDEPDNAQFWVHIDSTDMNVETFSDETVAPLNSYDYQIAAFNDVGKSGWVKTQQAVTIPEGPPEIPRSLEAAGTSISSIQLSWTDASHNEDGFVVQMSMTQDGEFAHVDSVGENVAAYEVEGLEAATIYYFRTASFNENGTSRFSNVAEGETWPPPPAAPTGLTVEAPDSRAAVLSWDDNSVDETGFNIERRDAEHPDWEQVGSSLENEATYRDVEVYPTWTYEYRVNAYNESGDSDYSNVVEATIPDGPPREPGNLTAVPLSHDRIQLAWRDRSVNEDGFIVERRLAGEEQFTIVTVDVPPDADVYIDTDLEAETTYQYRMKAYSDTQGESDYTDVAEATTLTEYVFYDNFEAYQVGSRPDHEAYNFNVEGNSDVMVTDEDSHDGRKCLRFLDASNDTISLVQALVTHDNVAHGVLNCFLKIASSGSFGVFGLDQGGNIGFQLQFNSDGTIWARHGSDLVSHDQLVYHFNQWFNLQITYNANVGNYVINLDGREFAPLNLGNLPGRFISVVLFSCYRNTSVQFVNVDQLTVSNLQNAMMLDLSGKKRKPGESLMNAPEISKYAAPTIE